MNRFDVRGRESSGHSARAEEPGGSQPSIGAVSPEASGGRDSQERERGGWRGRRRRRGGRRDGRDRDRTIGAALGRRPRPRVSPAPAIPRQQESGRRQQFGPPAGYQPIILPGESISKYQRVASAPVATESVRLKIKLLSQPPKRKNPSLPLSPMTNPSLPARPPLPNLKLRNTKISSRVRKTCRGGCNFSGLES